jgi:DNA polymerase-3 subunit alpha
MDNYGLKPEEQELLKPIVGLAYGICESQEKFMQLVQLPECGGFDLSWADRLRKSIAKKNPAEYEQLTKEFFENAKEKKLSYNLCNYVWNVLVATSRGYGFNASHTLAYSLVALQEMNLAYRFPIIFWNTACLITDSGGNEEDPEETIEEVVDIYEPEDFEEFEYIDAPDKKTKIKKKRTKTTDYKKIAIAISKMKQAGINIEPPNINTSTYTFTPDVENNKIIFGLSGILSVGEDVINETIANRPYSSPKDYLNKVKPKRQSMISLIKGGAFDSMMDRKLCMAWYIWETCDKKKRITLQNMPGLIKYNLLPEDTDKKVMARRIYEFNRYLKAVCKDNSTHFKLDERAINFLVEIGQENLMEEDFTLSQKIWDKKVYQV